LNLGFFIELIKSNKRKEINSQGRKERKEKQCFESSLKGDG
jgi:hypothetical protein